MTEPILTSNGYAVHMPDPEKDHLYNGRGDLHPDTMTRFQPNGELYDPSSFKGRRPILHDESKRHLYIGEPNWYHHDTYSHHDLPTDRGRFLDEGYVGGGKEWGNGNLKWYTDEPSTHPDVAQALTEAGIPVPNKDPQPIIPWSDEDDAAWEDDWEDDISGFHHPRA